MVHHNTLHIKHKIKQQEPSCRRELTPVPRKGKQFLLHKWRPSCYSCHKHRDQSYSVMSEWMREEQDLTMSNGTCP